MIGPTSRNKQSQKTERYSNKDQYPEILLAQAGDIRVRDRFIEKNIRLIRKVASKYSGLAEWNDLESAGRLGCANAIAKFDTTKGYKFSTYAIWPIKTEIRQLINELKGVSRIILDHLRTIDEASQELQLQLERDPTLTEIAERTGYSQQIILNAWDKERVTQTYSLNTLIGESQETEHIDLVEGGDDLWDFAEEIFTCDYINLLPEREAYIVQAKRDGYSNREIGKVLKLSRERVRQLFKTALNTLTNLVNYKKHFVRLTQQSQAETTTPISTHNTIEPIGEGDKLSLDLPAPEEAREPAIKRVNASRLGGRIGKAIQQIFNQTQEEFIHEPGELTHAQKHILVFRRRSHHRTADVAGHRLTSENQRCRQLERTEGDWRGYLGFSPVILNILLLPLASVSQSITGFQDNDRPNERRSMMSLITTGISKIVGCGYSREHPRPPNDFSDSDESLN